MPPGPGEQRFYGQLLATLNAPHHGYERLDVLEQIALRLLRAVARACELEPALNASYLGRDRGRRLYDTVDVGIAVLEPGTTRNHTYVAMTRGRDADYAYLSEAGDAWVANFHLHTTSTTPVDDVRIEYTIAYETYTDPSEFRGTTPYFLDVTGCNQGSVYDVPGGGGPNSVHVASRTYTTPADGISVFTGGHIHEGGIEASLTRDATGEDYCTATASYLAMTHHPYHPNLGTLDRISHCVTHSEVNAGEKFTLRSTYDNEIFVGKAMGIMLTHIWHPPA